MHPLGTTGVNAMLETEARTYRIADFATIPGVPCPCGTARRAFGDVEEFPGTIHVTEIALDARLHYHRRLTETYYFLECGPDAMMQLDDERIPVKPGLCIMIPPGRPAPRDRPDEGVDRGAAQVRPRG